MKIGIVLGGLALAGIALVAATPGPVPGLVQDAAAEDAAKTEATLPGPKHTGLAKLVGNWNLELKMATGPDTPDMTVQATSEVESVLGGRYVIEEVESEFMGGRFQGISITGYDNLAGTFENVWIDNQGTAMAFLKGEGEGDADGTIIWRGTRNDPTAGEIGVRGVHTMTGDGLTYVNYETVGGVEAKTFEITYTRKGLPTVR
jgi:hypothetical protein